MNETTIDERGNNPNDIVHTKWLIEKIERQLGEIMESELKLRSAEKALRDISTELRGTMRAWCWCCTNPDIEIIIDPMKTGIDGTVVNPYGVYNNYTCKNCKKTWKELVSSGPGYASMHSITLKEIEDYHKGYIKKPKLRCPVCHNAHTHIVIVNEVKKTHMYEIRCLNCDWKSDPIKHSWGYLKEKETIQVTEEKRVE